MGMLDDGLAFLAETLLDSEVAGETVTYTRKTHSASVTAIPGRRRRDEMRPTDARVVIDRERLDFLIDPATLIVNGVTITPETGDRITRADGTNYDVRPADGEPRMRTCEPYGHLIRVHTLRA